MTWYTPVLGQLRDCGLFSEVYLLGGKVRAMVDAARFVDIHFDPDTTSYSYALIDIASPYPGDKRIFGWDDYPHPGDDSLAALPSYPHHFQYRAPDGKWVFEASSFRGAVETDIGLVIQYLRQSLHP